MAASTDFLAVDLGASNGRVLLARWDGQRFDLQELHRFPNGPINVLGKLHWNVLGLWTEIKTGLARYASQHNAPPAGLGVDAWGVDFALLDRAGQLLGNPVHYRDARTNGIPDLVFAAVPNATVFERTGIQFMQINTLFQLYSLHHADDPQLEIAATLLMMPDLFHYWLTGAKVVEYTIATTSQMFDARARRWATELLTPLGLLTRTLPRVVASGTVLGALRPQVVEETGLAGATPIIATGSHDTASAVAAIPGLDASSAYISSGTWSLMGVEIDEPVINEQARLLNFTNEGGVGNTIRLLKNIAGLWLLQESRRQWQREGHDHSWDELLAMAEQSEPFRFLVDPDAADFLNPSNMVEAIRGYCNRTRQPQPESIGQVVRGCLESLALRYRGVLEALEQLTGRRLETLRIVGGGSQNRLLSQFAADACQRPVVTGPVEATALGNVMVQAIATGHLASVAEGRAAIAASIHQERFEPRQVAGWDEAFAAFSRLVE